MSRRIQLACSVFAVSLLAVTGLLLYWRITYDPDSLAAWLAQVQRPGYRLLYAGQTEDVFLAVCDAGKGQFALLSKARQSVPYSGSSSIRYDDGSSAEFAEMLTRRETRVHLVWLGIRRDFYQFVDGDIFTIRPGYSGTLHIRYEAGLTKFALEVPWKNGVGGAAKEVPYPAPRNSLLPFLRSAPEKHPTTRASEPATQPGPLRE